MNCCGYLCFLFCYLKKIKETEEEVPGLPEDNRTYSAQMVGSLVNLFGNIKNVSYSGHFSASLVS